MSTFMIVDDHPMTTKYYLHAATSAKGGTQCGVHRVWTEDVQDALRFETKAEAETLMNKDFEEFELRNGFIEVEAAS